MAGILLYSQSRQAYPSNVNKKQASTYCPDKEKRRNQTVATLDKKGDWP